MPVAFTSTSTSPAFGPVQLGLGDGQRLALLECDGGTGFHGGFPPRHLGRHELNWRTQGQGSPPEARLRKRCNGGEPNSLIKIPTDPSQRCRRGARMGSGPPDHATSHFEKKLQVSIEKHYTKK